MSYNYPIEVIENDVLIVSVQGAGDSYFMWQKGLIKEMGGDDGIYFEFNDQINGHYNLVKKCTIVADGITVVFANDESESICFRSDFDKLKELKGGLDKMYAEQAGIVEFSI